MKPKHPPVGATVKVGNTPGAVVHVEAREGFIVSVSVGGRALKFKRDNSGVWRTCRLNTETGRHKISGKLKMKE